MLFVCKAEEQWTDLSSSLPPRNHKYPSYYMVSGDWDIGAAEW